MESHVSETFITIKLDTPAPNGKVQMVFRMVARDKRLIDRAAKSLGLSTASFVRRVAVEAARHLLNTEQLAVPDLTIASDTPTTSRVTDTYNPFTVPGQRRRSR